MNKGKEIIGTFNSENSSHIDLIKKKAAELVDLIEEHGKDGRRKAIAITGIEQATMMAVKSTFENH
ncbi:DUF7681 family protein [Wohlfahrtiimonas larvae]|uniref:Acb2/Tad1 hairpin domain-containing protein n=1 Tax=Wohlfahrtiimonas larvae TaxID=1157986 RepID=A0ABP9MXT9_9GAMM|nr:hypothetical protein [Wohlfahrtiimonas larvae]